mgnify:CR=1 FL=1
MKVSIEIGENKMVKYAEISDLNNNQIKLINKNGWCIFTECDGDGTYWHKGMHCVNRIGYIILSENIDVEDINSYKELNKIATYDDVFDKMVREKLSPVADKCYVFLVKNPANYHFEQIWTNKGLEKAKEIAKLRFEFKHTYYDSKDYDKMENLIFRHNCKVRKDTEKAIEILKANGFKVVSDRFAALS